ncbi:MAG: bifunctional 4-hydroxy-2-oxoglutarate aldolase/2-dehydro-3-deoxy-phosphogluconate aldolase [Spirochaetales bacterium]|nr:bifunctional 4-hydroxy-2-oxoglutarate aldolase/2-dehydro-3-deoxy-phosphogluconate aldolase [Spirochaetales bacterium]
MKEIIPVVAFSSVDQALRSAEILERVGFKSIEVTFRTEGAEKFISAIKDKFDLSLGAGTVLNSVDLKKAYDAGVDFAVAPGLNPRIVNEAKSLGLDFFPGVATPSDIEAGLELGLRTFKFFPAQALGGLTYLSAIAAPYRHLGLKFMATGGITANNCSEYLACDDIYAVGGTWILSDKLLKSGDYKRIEALAVEAVSFFGK